jgi:succinoglycan biosynthesis protein ExoM
MLGDLLRTLGALRFMKCRPPAVRVVVVDNDFAGSARRAVEDAAESLPWPVTYLVEERRSLSLARNAAVGAALTEPVDFIAFVDDDELVAPDWLDELLSTQRQFSADAVCGPVLPRYEPEVPSWILRGRLLEPRRYRTGQPLDFGMTGNALISAQVLSREAEPFDLRFGKSGAEDTHFFMRLAQDGGRVVWADDAVVEEWVPASRARVGWMVRRAFRVGNCYVFCERALSPAQRWLARRLLHAIGRVMAGVMFFLPSFFLGRAAMVRSLRIAAHGVGSLAALGGIRYQEYRSV